MLPAHGAGRLLLCPQLGDVGWALTLLHAWLGCCLLLTSLIVVCFSPAAECWLAWHELPGFLPPNLPGLLQAQARERKKAEDGRCQTFLQNQWHSHWGSLCLNWCFTYNLPCTGSYHIRGFYLWCKPGLFSPGSASLCSSLERGLDIMTEISSDTWQEETSHSLLQNTGHFSFFIKATQVLCLKLSPDHTLQQQRVCIGNWGKKE